MFAPISFPGLREGGRRPVPTRKSKSPALPCSRLPPADSFKRVPEEVEGTLVLFGTPWFHGAFRCMKNDKSINTCNKK